MRMLLAVATMALALSSGFQKASAAMVTATYTGTISPTGAVTATGTISPDEPPHAIAFFGFPGVGNIANLPFTLTYTIDTDLGTSHLTSASAGVQGGPVFEQFNMPTTSPVTAVLTINSVNFTFQIFPSQSNGVSSATMNIHNADMTNWEQIIQTGIDGDFQNLFLLTNYTRTGREPPPLSLLTPITVTAGPEDVFEGRFFISCVETPCVPGPGVAYGIFDIETLTITSSSSVPLPGALPLFASGLGALGFLAWRRRAAARA